MDKYGFLPMRLHYRFLLPFFFVFILHTSGIRQLLAQEPAHVRFDTAVLLPKLSANNRPIGCLYRDTLVLLDSKYSDTQDSMFLYFVDVNTKQVSRIALSSEIFDAGVYRGHFVINAVTMGEDFLVLANGSGLFWFHRNGITLTADTVTPSDFVHNICSAFLLPSKKILIFGNYLPYNGNESEVSTLALVNPKTKQAEKTTHPDFVLPFLCYYGPKNLVSLTDSSILYAQSGEYRITEFDFDLNPIDTLLNSKIPWHKVPEDTMRACFNKYDQAVDRLWAMDSWNYRADILHFIHASENSLWVFYSKKGKEYKDRFKWCYDIWKKNNGKWIQDETDIKDFGYGNSPFNRHCIGVVRQPLFRTSNGFIRTSFLPYNHKEMENLPYEEWKQEMEKYMLDNDHVVGVEFFE